MLPALEKRWRETMFEIPEILTLSRQINNILSGKVVQAGRLGNSAHKFVWYNRSPEEFAALSAGKTVGQSFGHGRWLFVPLDPGFRLVFGECGGKILFHPPGAPLLDKFHLLLRFTDGSVLSVMTQMWGAMELYAAGEEQNRQYIRDMRPTPLAPEFNEVYFNQLVDRLAQQGKRSLKSLLTQDQLIPGLGNASAQDILFNAGLHPKRLIQELDAEQRRHLFAAIHTTVAEITRLGGRYDEFDLLNQPGGYVRIMDKHALQRPCPRCSGKVEKIQYLGGACYFCRGCQV
jgi:formamidopyrimidine-DNA glycosylase